MPGLMETLSGRAHAAPRRLSLLHRVNAVWALYRSRARLAELEPHLLEDIGLDPDTARAEAARPVWDAPSAWKA